MGLDLDVIVDVHRHRLEGGPLPALGWQGRQGGRIQRGEHAGPAAVKLAGSGAR
jgi:hypothetical protein